jgi:hypothetical protein
MPERFELEVRRETPTLDHYRRGWTPGPNVAVAGMWMGAVATDAASGKYYFGLRGADDFIPGMTHTVSPTCGFRALQKTLDAAPPHLFDEYASIDWFEPLTYADSGDRLQLGYDSGRIEHDAAGLHWHDASGRWEMHGKTVSDVCVIHVPEQPGIDREVYYRHELLLVKGAAAGVQVEGHLHLDYAYAPAGSIFTETAIPRQLQGMWVSWLHEFADGEVGGGHFWQGPPGISFGPGYVLKGGKTTVLKDVVAQPTFNDGGKLVALDFTIEGESYRFVFDMAGSPVHYFGHVAGISSRETPARSWCWVEYSGGMMTAQILDMMNQRYRLARGR